MYAQPSRFILLSISKAKQEKKKLLAMKFIFVLCLIFVFDDVTARDKNDTSPNFTDLLKNLFDGNNQKRLNSSQYSHILEDAFLTTPQLLKKYGYPVEVHTIQTADGYLLEMHRIPKPGGIPVLLQHGLLDSSAGWILMGRNISLAYILADEGYDVWMGNVRGSRYSKEHVYLNTKSKEFWDFSFHEIGTEDVPAMIDFITQTTEFQKIHYIGHSQGTTVFFIMCALKPEYCDKVLLMSALSPVVFMGNLKSPLIRALSLFTDPLEILFKILGVYEVLPNNDLMKLGGQIACKKESLIQALCTNIAFIICGYDSEQLNKTVLPIIIGHIPAGTSTKQLVHFGQLKKSRKFRMYDYGIIKNLFRYRQLKPPDYDLSKVSAPVAIYYSMNDWLADAHDVYKLQKSLPSVVYKYIVPLPMFNHLDFIFAKDVKTLLYDNVLDVMRKVEKSTVRISSHT